MWPQAKEHLEPPKAERAKEGSSPRVLEGEDPADTLMLVSAFRTVRGDTSVVQAPAGGFEPFVTAAPGQEHKG